MNTMILFFSGIVLACPVLALMSNSVLRSQPITGARLAGYFQGFAFIISLSLLTYLYAINSSAIYLGLSFDSFNILLSSLVFFVSFIVHRFSLRYMDGDRLYQRFFSLLSALTLSSVIMVLADNLFLFWLAFSLSNCILVVLMIHKKEWKASKNSGALAGYTLTLGSLLLLIAFSVLYFSFSTSSIRLITANMDFSRPFIVSMALSLIAIASLAQSALWPFHRWLVSSLNSPTPVSAMMHAGLVNGGGIILVKFAPLLIAHQSVLFVLFLTGALSALLGTVWKLMQNDIKKMLSCSTMAQMGFMMMQCGLGLFAPAIAHLCWHGLFKAHLFLTSGSAVAQNKVKHNTYQPVVIPLLASLLGGSAALASFCFMTDKTFSFSDVNSFVLFFAFIAGAQLMHSWFRNQTSISGLIISLFLAGFFGLIYGFSVHLIEMLLPGLSSIKTPDLSLMHWAIMFLFGLLWLVFNLNLHKKFGESALGCWLYMNLFNASQPALKTMTTHRTDYNY